MRTLAIYLALTAIFTFFCRVFPTHTTNKRELEEYFHKSLGQRGSPPQLYQLKLPAILNNKYFGIQRKDEKRDKYPILKPLMEADQEALSITTKKAFSPRILHLNGEQDNSGAGNDTNAYEDLGNGYYNTADIPVSTNNILTGLYGLPIVLILFCICFGRVLYRRRQRDRRIRNRWHHGEVEERSLFCCFCCLFKSPRRSSVVQPQGIALHSNSDNRISPFVNNNHFSPIQLPKKEEKLGKFKLDLKEVLTPSEDEQCKICFTYKKNAVLFPCMHSICHICLVQMVKCPFCRGDITDAKPLQACNFPLKRQITL